MLLTIGHGYHMTWLCTVQVQALNSLLIPAAPQLAGHEEEVAGLQHTVLSSQCIGVLLNALQAAEAACKETNGATLFSMPFLDTSLDFQAMYVQSIRALLQEGHATLHCACVMHSQCVDGTLLCYAGMRTACMTSSNSSYRVTCYSR